MKSIAGAVVVLGACILLGAVAAAPAGTTEEGLRYSADLRNYAVGMASVLAVFGLVVTFSGSRSDA